MYFLPNGVKAIKKEIKKAFHCARKNESKIFTSNSKTLRISMINTLGCFHCQMMAPEINEYLPVIIQLIPSDRTYYKLLDISLCNRLTQVYIYVQIG